MGIDIGRLKAELLRMSAADAPGREFCEAISDLSEDEARLFLQNARQALQLLLRI